MLVKSHGLWESISSDHPLLRAACHFRDFRKTHDLLHSVLFSECLCFLLISFLLYFWAIYAQFCPLDLFHVFWHLGRCVGVSAGESWSGGKARVSLCLSPLSAWGMAISLCGFCPHLLEACAVVIRSLQVLGSDITPYYQTHSSLPLSSLLGTVPRANVFDLWAAPVAWKLSFYFFIIFIFLQYFFSLC